MVNAGLLSKGTTLSYIENGNVKTIAGVRSIPTVGNDPEKVDVTNLGSSKKRYAKGLQDTDNLEFSVIYKGENFKDIHRLVELDKTLKWLVMYPDGMTVRFTGEAMLKIDGVEVNAAVGFSIVIVVSDGPNIEFAKEPQRPTELKASNVQFDQFNLSWNGSGLFRIYVDRNNVGETYNNTFTVTGLKPSSKHIVSVASVSGVNEVHAVPITVTTTALPKITKINVPQRLDLYVDETKQLDVSTVPGEAMRAYEHVNKAVLDNSIVKFDGDKVSGVSAANGLGWNNFFGGDITVIQADIERKGKNYVTVNSVRGIYVFFRGHFGNSKSVKKDHKYYLAGNMSIEENGVNVDDIVGCSIQFAEKVGNFFGKIASKSYLEMKKDSKLSAISEVSEDNEFEVQFNFEIRNYKNVPKKTSVTLENPIFVDLTEDFGAGNEPTKEWCDNNIVWTVDNSLGYSYTNANVTFNDAEKSSAEFDIFVHERKRMTSPTESDTASFIL